MGAGQSKDELLYQEVLNGNYDKVKVLRRDGASLEWIDKEGRTPLILACTRGELFDMAITLLNLGANINAYRPGTHGGFPLHHAAKRGLEKTVTLLLSRGADPLAINDDGQTPLDMARSRGHVSIVRLFEERLSLFSGMVRELSGLGIVEMFAPNLCTKKIWVAVLPTESRPLRAPRYELAIYISPKVAQPRTVIHLSKTEVEEPRFSLTDPVLYITDKATKAKYKFLSENEGDKLQLERFYRACKGILQVQGGVTSIHPATPEKSETPPPVKQPEFRTGTSAPPNTCDPGKPTPSAAAAIPQDAALALALDASIRSATGGIPGPSNVPFPSREDDYNGWVKASDGSYSGWGPPDSKKNPKKTSYGGWEEGEMKDAYSGWGPGEAGPSRSQPSAELQPQTPPHGPSSGREGILPEFESASATHIAPSAPPLPDVLGFDSGPIQYPSIDVSTVEVDCSSAAVGKGVEKVNGMCVVCWDAPAEGACIPCGHLAGCMSCLSEIERKKWGCPVCRGLIQQVVKVYAV